MMLKKVMHHICGRLLDKQAAETNVLIRDVELLEQAAMSRLKAKADDYRSQAAAYRSERDAKLDAFVAFMGDQVRQAESYAACLGDFQDKIFVCFDSWMNTSVLQQRVRLLHEKTTTKQELLDFIRVLQAELEGLMQRDERNVWQDIIQERGILTVSPLIERNVRQVNGAVKSSNDAVRRDMKRLRSHSIRLRTELDELRHERDSLKASGRELIEAHKQHKAELNERYRTCSELFGKIRDRFSDHVGAAPTANVLANSWIADIDGSVTLAKLITTHGHALRTQKELQDELSRLSSDFQTARSRIEECRRSEDYSNFDQEKSTRDRLFHERREVGEQRREVADARGVLQARINEVKSMLGIFTSLHPDESIRHVIKIFDMGDDFDMHRAVGVSTAEDRKRHQARKNQNRPA